MPALTGTMPPPQNKLTASVPAMSDAVAAPVVGAVRVKTCKLPGVPYCVAHKKAVEMTTEIGNKLFLDWRSLAMMRRYMAANRGRFVESSSSGKS